MTVRRVIFQPAGYVGITSTRRSPTEKASLTLGGHLSPSGIMVEILTLLNQARAVEIAERVQGGYSRLKRLK